MLRVFFSVVIPPSLCILISVTSFVLCVCIWMLSGMPSGRGQVSVCGHDVTLFQSGSLRGHDTLWTASVRTPGWDVYLACSPNTIRNTQSLVNRQWLYALHRLRKMQGWDLDTVNIRLAINNLSVWNVHDEAHGWFDWQVCVLISRQLILNPTTLAVCRVTERKLESAVLTDSVGIPENVTSGLC